MPQVIFNDVKVAFANYMTRESEYGGWNYSVIIDKNVFCDKVREALVVQKTQIWPKSKNTNDFILKKCNAKSKDDVTHEATKERMGENDVLVQVKSKEGPIENSKKVPLGRGSIVDALVDVFEFEYGKKQFICMRSHASKGCTVKVKELVEFSNGPKFFDFEDEIGSITSYESNNGINMEAMEETVPF